MDRGKETHYRISTYIFVPRSLGITEQSYPKDELYRDIKNYIRIKTPQMSLRDLIDDDLSPLRTMQGIIQKPGWYLEDAQNKRVVHSLRLFGGMFKSSLREHLNLLDRRMKMASPKGNIHPLVGNLIDEMIVESEKIGTQYRMLYTAFNMPHIAEEVFLAHLLVDEYISLLIEESVTDLFRVVSQHYGWTNRIQYCQRLNEIVDRETAHRTLRGYGSVLKIGDENETYAFRASVIKKYVSEVLHLTIDAQREGKGIEQVLLAFAAGISMVFATEVAFYFRSVYGSFTFPAFVALTVGYMFKDRIKQLGQTLEDHFHEGK